MEYVLVVFHNSYKKKQQLMSLVEYNIIADDKMIYELYYIFLFFPYNYNVTFKLIFVLLWMFFFIYINISLKALKIHSSIFSKRDEKINKMMSLRIILKEDIYRQVKLFGGFSISMLYNNCH